MTLPEIRPATLDLAGTWTALITPFRDGAVDEWPCAASSSPDRWRRTGIVACGTTAETPTLSPDESDRDVAIVIEQARAGSR